MINQLAKAWPFVLSLVILSSCMRYQYATVSSPLKQNLKHEFVHENDSIQVVYNFHGAGGPIKISVYNKLDTPIFVNWRMSSLIVDGLSRSYKDNVSTMQGNASGTALDWGSGFSTTNSAFSGMVSHDEEVSFIPPGRFVTATPAALKSGFFASPPNIKPARKVIRTVSGNSTGRSYLYASENSPLQYQSYLTYSADVNFSSIATVEDSFWVSELMVTLNKPSNILNMEDRQADTFYNSKVTGFGGTMAALALIILAAVSVSIQP